MKGKRIQRGERAGKEGIATSNSTCAAQSLNKIEYKGISIIVDTQNPPDKLSQNSAEFTIQHTSTSCVKYAPLLLILGGQIHCPKRSQFTSQCHKQCCTMGHDASVKMQKTQENLQTGMTFSL
jgi:hypothetical protein